MNRGILLAQHLEEDNWGLTQLELEVSKAFGTNAFCIDNKSDAQAMQYATQFIKEIDKPVTILWDHVEAKVFKFQPLFNALLARKNAALLITNSTNTLIARLEKAITVQRTNLQSEVIALAQKW